MIAWSTSGFLVLLIIKCESNHSNAFIISRAGSECVDNFGFFFHLFDLGVCPNVTTFDDFLSILVVESDLENVEVSIIITDACNFLFILEIEWLVSALIFLSPLSRAGSIREVEFDRLKSIWLEFVWNSRPLNLLQEELIQIRFGFLDQVWNIWNAWCKSQHAAGIIALLGLKGFMIELVRVLIKLRHSSSTEGGDWTTSVALGASLNLNGFLALGIFSLKLTLLFLKISKLFLEFLVLLLRHFVGLSSGSILLKSLDLIFIR